LLLRGGWIVRCELVIFEKGEWKISRRGVSVPFGGIGFRIIVGEMETEKRFQTTQ